MQYFSKTLLLYIIFRLLENVIGEILLIVIQIFCV